MRRLVLAAAAALLLGGGTATVSMAGEDSDWGYAGWDKGFRFESADGKNTLKISNRAQIRFTFESPEEGDSVGSFRIRRWKFKMSGKIYEHWKYNLQVNFAGQGDRELDVEDGAVQLGQTDALEDVWFQYTRNRWFQPRIGQMKPLFGRQRLTSSGKLQFVDRAGLASEAEVSRDIGAALIGQNESKTFEYNVGMYNGNALNQKENDNGSFQYTGRVVWTPFGEYGLAEGALDRPDSARLAIGLDGLVNTLTTDAGEDFDIRAGGIEFAFKLGGFSTVAEYFVIDREELGAGGTVDSKTGYVQAGYLFENNLEVAVRYATIVPDDELSLDEETSIGAALSYYFDKHDYKAQADVRRIRNDTSDEDEDVVRLQVQFSF
jgi:phosphate-selective porin